MAETLHDEQLAAFQALLLDLLERGVEPQHLKAQLMEHEAAAPFREYVAAIEPRCLEIASRIVKKWAIRDPDAV